MNYNINQILKPTIDRIKQAFHIHNKLTIVFPYAHFLRIIILYGMKNLLKVKIELR